MTMGLGWGVFTDGVDVEVLAPTLAPDRFSGDTSAQDWTAPTVVATHRMVPFFPGPSADQPQSDRPSRITDEYTAMLPYETPALSGHRLRITSPGRFQGDWDIDGEPRQWGHPATGWHACTAVTVRRVNG